MVARSCLNALLSTRLRQGRVPCLASFHAASAYRVPHRLRAVHDGYRTQLVIAGRDIRAYTRNGFDWTDRYAPVVASARTLNCKSAIPRR